VRVAVLEPVADGVKVKRMVQEALAAIVPALAQVPPLRTKFAALVPVMVKNGVESVSVDVPEFETVTVRGELVVLTFWLPKAAGDGARPITGVTPVPVKESVALTVPLIVRTALMAPVVAGVKIRFTVHDPLAAIVPPATHVPVPAFAKAAAFGPVIVKYGVDRVSVAFPVFETVTVKGALEVPVR
jgi:hypothetical protein